MGDLDWIFF